MPVSDVQFRMAWAQGEVAGRDPASSDLECPHDHDETELRFAWLEGFEDGKAQRQKTTASTNVSSTEQRRRHSVL